MRIALLIVALAFTALLGVFTVRDLMANGVTAPGLLGVLVVVLFAFGIVGALLERPKK